MTAEQLAKHIFKHCSRSRRCLIGIAGPPASGKSTLATRLEELINEEAGEAIAVVVPMDGFHLDNAELDQLGLRACKGSPLTFDAPGFVDLISRLKTADSDVLVPLFDRTLDATVADAAVVNAEQRLILVEGNYLLLAEEPWQQLQALFDLTVFVNPGLDVLEQRLLQRWLDHGFDAAAAWEKAQSNDLPNAQYVLDHSAPADLLLEQ